MKKIALHFLGIKNKVRRMLVAVILCMAAFDAAAQRNHFIVPVDFMVENGSTNKTIVKVIKDGQAEYSLPGKSNMRLKLDFNHDYIISFNKKGYITKSITIVTNIPAERISKPVEPYKIGVKIFKQYEGVNVVIYNQPVAKIHFNTLLDDFDYDTDYTKSILSVLNNTEQQLSAKAAEERLSASATMNPVLPDDNKKQDNSSSSSGQLKEKPSVKVPALSLAKQSAILEPLHDSQKSMSGSGSRTNENNHPISSKENENKPALNFNQDKDEPFVLHPPAAGNDDFNRTDANSGYDVNRNKLIPSTGYDAGDRIAADGGMDINKEAILISGNATYYRKQWSEHGRSITMIKIINGLNTSEYRKVDYDWGGVYYFKNQYFAISKNVYQWATGEK